MGNLLSKYTNIFLNKSQFFDPSTFNWNSGLIDVYLDDGDHFVRGLNKNLGYWLPKLRTGGLMIFHDYRPHLPKEHQLRFYGVEKAVDILISQGYKKVRLTGSLIILQKF